VYFRESLTFQSYIFPHPHPSSGSKNKPSKKPAEAGGRLSKLHVKNASQNRTDAERASGGVTVVRELRDS
jgi:hypothetical protein